MKHVKLGSLNVGRIGLGTMGMSFAYTGAGSDDAESIRAIHRAIDLGVTLIDTAEVYGPYTNEELLGQALKGHRDQVVLATKFGMISHTGRDGLDSSPASIRTAIEGSLRRLGTDHIDLYYQHRVDPGTPIEDTIGVLANLVTDGKIRHIGLSEAVLAVAVVATMVAGCGAGSTASTTSATNGAPSSAAADSGSGGSSSGGLKAAVNVCALMPVPTIARIVGHPFDSAQRDDTPSYQQYNCDYTSKVTSSGGGDQLELGIEGLDASVGYGADLSAEGHNAKLVSGIGDKAFSAGVSAELEVLYGSVLIKITGLTATTIAQDKQIISQLHAKL
jgi:hypothetical protein